MSAASPSPIRRGAKSGSTVPAMQLHPLVEEWDRDLQARDLLDFPGYAERLEHTDGEAVRTGRTQHYAIVESRFENFGGSMGVAAGEKVTRAFGRAAELRLPMLVVTRSGGARMQEGMLALVQMGRTAAAVRRHASAGLLSLAVLGSPTTGGVFASYGWLCDLRAAEEGATIGFAGPRVVAQMVGIDVAGRSHTAESAYAHGLVDALVTPDVAHEWVAAALGLRASRLVVRPLPPAQPDPDGTDAWAEVLRSRRCGRPSGIDIAAALCTSWTELSGTDPTTRAGLATIAGQRCMVVAHDRYARDGRPRPAGFRLAQRAIALADRLGLPLVTLVDTPGADPSPAAELDGAAGEIARTFEAMAGLSTPSVAVCVGEGGSGGALALGHTDRLLIQEHAVFSVIAPEGAAAILERDATNAAQVAAHLGLTSRELRELGVVDAVVPDDVSATVAAVVDALGEARPGDRERRTDAATRRALRID